MTTTLSETPPGVRDLAPALVRAWLVTGVVDGLFSSALSVFAYGSTVSRLFQGVASVPLGPAAFDGGAPTVALGLVMHFGVAFGWSAVFLLLVTRSAWIRGVLRSTRGVDHDRSRLWTRHLDGDVAGGHSPLHTSSPGDHVSLVGPVLRPLSVRRGTDRGVSREWPTVAARLRRWDERSFPRPRRALRCEALGGSPPSAHSL